MLVSWKVRAWAALALAAPQAVPPRVAAEAALKKARAARDVAEADQLPERPVEPGADDLEGPPVDLLVVDRPEPERSVRSGDRAALQD